MNSELLVLLFAVQAAGWVVLVVLWHKVRRIHLSAYRTNELLTQVHQETLNLYPQLVAQAGLERLLSLAAPLPPMRGWAGSPDFLLSVARHLLQQRPATIVECSSGVSTLVAARCCQLNGQGHVYSLEHAPGYAQQTRALLQAHGLAPWATVVDAPLEQGTDGRVWYRDSALPPQARGIDVLVIDGPPQDIGALARLPALPRLRERFASEVWVFLDDADRPDERQIVDHWLLDHPGFEATRPPAEKGLAVLHRRGTAAARPSASEPA